jgi:hypothetical protein
MSRLSSLGPEQQVIDVTCNVRGSSVGTGHMPRAADHPIVFRDTLPTTARATGAVALAQEVPRSSAATWQERTL